MHGDSTAWLAAVSGIGSLILAVLIALLSLVVRITRRATIIESDVKANTRVIDRHLDETGKVHASIFDAMREDRKAANERLSFLERQRMHP